MHILWRPIPAESIGAVVMMIVASVTVRNTKRPSYERPNRRRLPRHRCPCPDDYGRRAPVRGYGSQLDGHDLPISPLASVEARARAGARLETVLGQLTVNALIQVRGCGHTEESLRTKLRLHAFFSVGFRYENFS